jgi:hypothetical protein
MKKLFLSKSGFGAARIYSFLTGMAKKKKIIILLVTNAGCLHPDKTLKIDGRF